MKKLFYFIPLAVCLTFGLIGCSSDDEDGVDPPIICQNYQDPVEIMLVDKDGKNVLIWENITNPELKKAKVVYCGGEYELTENLLIKPVNGKSPEQATNVFSLKNTKEDLDNILMSFGGFLTYDNFTQEFDLKWNDGTIDKIKMEDSSEKDPNNSGISKHIRKVYLNGKLCEGSIVKIIKDKL